MENLLWILIAVAFIGFGIAIFLLFQLLKEMRKANDINYTSLHELKNSLEELKSISQTGLSATNNALTDMRQHLIQITNQISSTNSSLTDVKLQLEKIKVVSQTGFAQMILEIKETIKLD